VTWLRAFSRRHSWLLALAVLTALALRMLVPTGYMVRVEPDRVAVSLCTAHGTETVYIDRAPGKQDQDRKTGDAAKRCAFADFSVPGLPAVPLLELAAALVFILALWLARVEPLRLADASRLRPPLRGPPSLV